MTRPSAGYDWTLSGGDCGGGGGDDEPRGSPDSMSALASGCHDDPRDNSDDDCDDDDGLLAVTRPCYCCAWIYRLEVFRALACTVRFLFDTGRYCDASVLGSRQCHSDYCTDGSSYTLSAEINDML